MFLCSLIYCVIGLSVSGLPKIRSNTYALCRISKKKSVPKETRIPVVHVNNFRMVSLRFSVPSFIVLSIWASAVYAKYVSTPIHSVEFPQKNQFSKKPGFPLSALIILDRSNVDLLFKTESRKIRIISNKVYLAIPKRATITCRDKKKPRS